MGKEIVEINAEKISKMTKYSIEEIAVVKANVAKNVNDSELAYFLNVCKTVGLNPFNKEIWCYKDKKQNLLIFAGRDGFLAKAQTNPDFAGIRSSEVCEEDEFELDIANNKIKHNPNYSKPRTNIYGAYAIVFRKNGEPTIEWADDKVYNKKHFTWETHHAEMIKKVAETHALKKAFGISGIQAEYDYTVSNDVATPISTELKEVPEEEKIEVLQKTVNDLLRSQPKEFQEKYQAKMKVAKDDGQLTYDYLLIIKEEVEGELNE